MADSTELIDLRSDTVTKPSLQNDKPNSSLEITKILENMNLLKYHDVFVENCFDDLYSVLGIILVKKKLRKIILSK